MKEVVKKVLTSKKARTKASLKAYAAKSAVAGKAWGGREDL